MKNFLPLIEYLEANHHYQHVDEMMKVAFDLPDMKDNELGKGQYGRFYSDFSPEQKKKIEDALGIKEPNLGIKKLNYGQNIDAISENLALIYISPYVQANTDLKTPILAGTFSLSNILMNKIHAVQKMPGVKINLLKLDHFIFDEHLKRMTNVGIENKLRSIGVYCSDIHVNNYFVNPQLLKTTVEEINKIYNENKANIRIASINEMYDFMQDKMNHINFDLSDGASLFDFGFFTAKKDSPPGQKLMNLKQELLTQKYNSMFANIIAAIDNILR